MPICSELRPHFQSCYLMHSGGIGRSMGKSPEMCIEKPGTQNTWHSVESVSTVNRVLILSNNFDYSPRSILCKAVFFLRSPASGIKRQLYFSRQEYRRESRRHYSFPLPRLHCPGAWLSPLFPLADRLIPFCTNFVPSGSGRHLKSPLLRDFSGIYRGVTQFLQCFFKTLIWTFFLNLDILGASIQRRKII